MIRIGTATASAAVASAAPAAPITPRLVARRHVDYARVCSALCRR